MRLVEINWVPNDRQLRQFGILCICVFPFLGWLCGVSLNGLLGMMVLGSIVAILAFVLPQTVKPIFLGLMLISAPIGMILGELAMLLIFFGIFVPISLIFRLMRRDALGLKIDRNAETYWQPKAEPNFPSSYYRLF